MSKSFRNDLTGQRFDRLTVLKFVPTEKKQSSWLCKCDCGNEKIIEGRALTNGTTRSCGCIHAGRNKIHGGYATRLYRIWDSIKRRCEKQKGYVDREITICNEWKNNFVAFRNWALSNGYRDDLTIDRIDVNGNYEPSNCRWTDEKTQARNKTNNHIIKYNGKVMSIAEAADLANMPYQVFYSRFLNGDRGEKLLRPVKNHKGRKHIWIEYNGEKMPVRKAAELSGIEYSTFIKRYNRGERGEKLFRPVDKNYRHKQK